MIYKAFKTPSARRPRNEAGEAEWTFFIVALIATAALSGGIWALDWYKSQKDEKIANRGKKKVVERIVKRDPGLYSATCQKPLWAAFSTSVSCSVNDESYVEKELEEIRYN